MLEEIESLHQNETWDLIPLPHGKRAIGCKWIFKKKEGTSISGGEHYKARLVAKGYAQKEGIISMRFSHLSLSIILFVSYSLLWHGIILS